jgi:hypothetical protein
LRHHGVAAQAAITYEWLQRAGRWRQLLPLLLDQLPQFARWSRRPAVWGRPSIRPLCSCRRRRS